MKRILIMEDDERLSSEWRAVLEEHGFQVTCENSVEGAIDALEESRFDVVITDLLLRDENAKLRARGGLSLISHIRLRWLKDRPILIGVTGSDESLNMKRHAEALRVDRALSKPVSGQEVANEVKRLLAERER